MTLEIILEKEFPELNVDVPSKPVTSDIKPEELTNAIRYIRDEKLVQDSQKLLDASGPIRSSVTYPIIFPNQERELSFRVDWIQGPMVYIGYIETQGISKKVSQFRMYGLRLK